MLAYRGKVIVLPAGLADKLPGKGMLDLMEILDLKDMPRTQPSFGEILPDSSIVEPVLAPTGKELVLLRWNGQDCTTASHIQVGNQTYCAPFVNENLLRATRFPTGATDYDSGAALIHSVALEFQRFFPFEDAPATALGLWVLNTWLADFFPSPTTLVVTGSDMPQARDFFQLLHTMSRRPLMVSELSRRLPFDVRPTLLVCDPTFSEKGQLSWCASNHRGFFVPDRQDGARNLACSKAIFLATRETSDAWGPEALRIWLPPANHKMACLTEVEQARLAARFQPQFLMFRLHNLANMTQSIPADWPPALAESALARQLLACAKEERAVVEAVTPLLLSYQQEHQEHSLLDPHAAILECIWGPAHGSRQVRITELQEDFNGLLRSRGEIYEYSVKEVGWKLQHMSFERVRDGAGKVLRFTAGIRRRIHKLVYELGLDLPRESTCPDCLLGQTPGNYGKTA